MQIEKEPTEPMEADSPPTVLQVHESLELQIKYLAESITELEEKLKPILAPYFDDSVEEAERKFSGSHLRERVNLSTQQIVYLRARVEVLISRVEL